MVLRMVSLARDPKTGSWKSRKVIPEDIRAAYGKRNETPTWVATLTPAQAKAAWAAWLTEVEAKIDRLRRVAAAEPTSLTHREVHALAGDWYQGQVKAYEDDPGHPLGWETGLEEIEAEDEKAAYEAYLRGEEYEGPVKRIARLEDQAEALLEGEGLVLTPGSRAALLDRMHELYPALCRLMLRRTAGDYGADPLAGQLPAWEPLAKAEAAEGDGVSVTSLFDRYVAERQPAASTIKAWRR